MKMMVGGKWQHKGESQQARKKEGNTSTYWAIGANGKTRNSYNKQGKTMVMQRQASS